MICYHGWMIVTMDGWPVTMDGWSVSVDGWLLPWMDDLLPWMDDLFPWMNDLLPWMYDLLSWMDHLLPWMDHLLPINGWSIAATQRRVQTTLTQIRSSSGHAWLSSTLVMVSQSIMRKSSVSSTRNIRWCVVGKDPKSTCRSASSGNTLR